MSRYYTSIGGVPLTAADPPPLDALCCAAGNHVRPLAHAPERDWYLRVYRGQVAQFPGLRVPPGSVQHHVAHVKPVIIDFLQRLLGEG